MRAFFLYILTGVIVTKRRTRDEDHSQAVEETHS